MISARRLSIRCTTVAVAVTQLLWVGSRYMFAAGDGSLIEYDDDSAVLSGFAYSAADPTSGFDVTINLQGRTDIAPPDSPKKELRQFGLHREWRTGRSQLPGATTQAFPEPSRVSATWTVRC